MNMKTRSQTMKDKRMLVIVRGAVAIIVFGLFSYMVGYSDGQADTYEKIKDERTVQDLYKVEVDGE
jgi:hypothetical protein